MAQVNGDHEVGSDNPKRPPRRISSISEALDMIGTSFHNIYDKHAHKKTSNTKSRSKSNLHHPDDPEHDEIKNMAAKKHRSKSLKVGRKISQDKNDSDSPQTSSPTTPKEIINGNLKNASNLNPKPSPTKDPFEFKVKPPNSPQVSAKDSDSVSRSSGTNSKPTFPTAAPRSKQKFDRRSSMQWVDYLTEDGVQLEGGVGANNDNDSDFDEDELRDEPGNMYSKHRRPSEMSRRKIWFNKAIESASENDEDEFAEENIPIPENDNSDSSVKPTRKINGDFDSPANNFYRRIRKDSIAVSLKSVRSVRSMRTTPEP